MKHGKVWMDKHLSDMSPIQDDRIQKTCFIAFPFQLCFRIPFGRHKKSRTDGNWKERINPIPLHAAGANLLSDDINTRTDALNVASKEAGLEVNNEKTRYMFMCW